MEKLLLTIFILSLVTPATAEIDFKSNEPIDFYNTINLNGNEIRGFFNQSCGKNLVVKDVYDNGSFKCGAPGSLGAIVETNNTLTKNIDANNYHITNLADPISAQDGATKSYVDNNDDTGTDNQDLSIESDPSNGGSTTIAITNGSNATFTDDFEADTDAQSQCGNDQVLTGSGCVSKYDSGDDGDTSSSNEIQDLGQVVSQNNNADGNINMGDNSLLFNNTSVTEQSGNHLILQGRDPDQQLRLTDGGSLVYEEYHNGENVFEVDSQSDSAASVRIGEEGGTVNLDMNNNKVTNLAAPTNSNDAVRQQDLSNYVNKNGDTMNGNLSLNGNKLQNVGGTDCANNEALLGDGSCGSTASTLSTVMSNGNSASTNLDMNGKNITDSSKGNVTISQDLKVHGNLNLGGNNLTSTGEICAGNACDT